MPIPRPIVAVPANLIREGGRGGEGAISTSTIIMTGH